jgi:hypothetical protein
MNVDVDIAGKIKRKDHVEKIRTGHIIASELTTWQVDHVAKVRTGHIIASE